MSTPDEQSLMERLVILQFVLDQQRWVTQALLARCGGEAKLNKDEMDFVMKSYEMDESISMQAQTLDHIYMKLRLKG